MQYSSETNRFLRNIKNQYHIIMNNYEHDKYKTDTQKINVALVSDFYYPFVGGVQIHIKQLATLLSKNQQIGNVIVITHKYDHHSLQYTGVRNHHGFRVHYLNIHYNKQHMITYPTFIFNFQTAAKILTEQKIDIVHCHQTGSTLGLEFIFFARVLGLRVLLTQHSLYGFRTISDIHFNRVSRLFVNFCDYVIAVSKTTRNNIILRTGIDKNRVIVIPNGVSDISAIRKKRQANIMSKSEKNCQKIKIISVGRMTFRRGTDILIEILPQLCELHEDIQILIVGDGVKRNALQKIIEINQLHHKVKMLGIISSHESLLEKMAQCDIFLNTPLTESFGIALAEAAMLGLYCVSTNVGGVQQAIPKQHLFVSKVDPTNLLQVLSIAIEKVRKKQKPVQKTEVFEYKWQNVCNRTVQLYSNMMKQQKKSKKYYMKKAVMTGNLLEIFFTVLGFILAVLYSLPFFK